jgi:arginine deiminase
MIIENKDIINTYELGVFEETSPLKKILVWGPSGVEASLAQLLPKEVSCFETEFNVMKARNEIGAAVQTLEDEGIEVVEVKSLLAKMIDEQRIEPQGGIRDLQIKLEERIKEYTDKYSGKGMADKKNVIPHIKDILEADVNLYGERAAIIINEMLSLRSDLPLGNILYARDQSNLLGNTMIWSSMAHEIRQPEVNIFMTTLRKSGLLNVEGLNQIEVNGKGRFEGGDGIANNGIFYIGAGGRTNCEGILQAAPSLIKDGGKVMIVLDPDRDSGTQNEMDAMHLDTYWMPVSPNQIIACEDEVCKRKIFEVVDDCDRLKIEDRGWFADHLAKRGTEIIPLTKDEQLAYAPNLLNLGDKKVILSLANGNNLTGELQKRGFTVFNANLQEITKGYGGLHCSTAAIKRE